MTMERDQEWPEGSEPHEPKPGDDAGWFFDLPGGAWERQEEKNRELRRRIVENISGQPNEQPDEEKQPRRGLFGRSRKGDDSAASRETAGGTFRLGRGDDPAEATGEPQPPSDAPPILPLHHSQAADQPDSDDDWSTEPSDFRVTPFPSSRRSETGEAAGDTTSRWDEMFGAGADDSGIVEGMRGWAKGDAAPPVETTETEIPHDEPPEPAEPAAPRSRWDVAFGSAILPEPEPPAPAIGEMAIPEVSNEQLVQGVAQPVPDAVQPVPQPPKPGEETLWDSLLDASTDSGNILEGMRRWAKSDPLPAEPADRENRRADFQPAEPTAGAAFGDVSPSLPSPAFSLPTDHSEIADRHPEPRPSRIQQVPQPEKKKPGLFRRMFGRKDSGQETGGIPAGRLSFPDNPRPTSDEPAQGDIVIANQGGDQSASAWLVPTELAAGWAPPAEEDTVGALEAGDLESAEAQPATAWLASAELAADWAPPAEEDTAAEAGDLESAEVQPATTWLAPTELAADWTPPAEEDTAAAAEAGDLESAEAQPTTAWLAPIELAADWTPPAEEDTVAALETGDLESAEVQPTTAWLAPSEPASDWTPPAEEDTAATAETSDVQAAEPVTPSTWLVAAELADGQSWQPAAEPEHIEPAVYWHIDTSAEVAPSDEESEESRPPTIDSPLQLSFATSTESVIPSDSPPAPPHDDSDEDGVGWNPEPFDAGATRPVLTVAFTAPPTEDTPAEASGDAGWSGETDDEDPWASLKAPALEVSPADTVEAVFASGRDPLLDDSPADERSAEAPIGWEATATHLWEPPSADSSPSSSTPPPIERGDVSRWLEIALEASELDPELPSDWRSSPPAEAPDGSQTEPRLSSITAGDWQLDDDDDIVLKAFEAHARTEIDEDRIPDAQPGASPATTFSELLGNDGDALVAELTDPAAEVRPFSRFQGLAPQRANAGEISTLAPAIAIPGVEPGGEGPLDAGFLMPGAGPGEDVAASALTPGHSRVRTFVREAVETLLLAVLVFLAVRASFQNFKVDGSSMYPTLENGEFLIVNKLVYSEVDLERLSRFIPFVDPGNDPQRNVFHAPERGDIVVLKDPRDPQQDLIKRVIGLPNETLEIRDGKVYVNDHLLEEPYLKSAWHDSKSSITLGPDEYFVMGDNRENSLDSRSMSIGLIHKDLIIGKAMLSYWPTSKFGLAPNGGGKMAADISTKDGKPVVTAQRIGE